jgi:hypothetical protein
LNIKDILKKIGATEAPLARQLLMTGLITRRLEDRGKPAPVLIGGLALSYYTREVYFTADIDLAYEDREALAAVLDELGFIKSGRYWVHTGLEDLIIDRMNACKHWKSEVDCEMTELLIARYENEIDWAYLENKASLPENDTLAELRAFKGKGDL